MGPVENNINLLISELKNNQKIGKDQALDYLGHVVRMVTNNNIPASERWGASMTINEYLKKARVGNLTYAEGFFGNWSKSIIDEKDQDVGC